MQATEKRLLANAGLLETRLFTNGSSHAIYPRG